jgi:site-specific DNA-cytosine methylase
MLNSVELFAGVSGQGIALSGIAQPILYCDNDPIVNNTLNTLMSKGRIHKAPIVQDVRDLEGIKKAVDGKTVDIITSSFPCVGFSLAGQHRGLQNEHSNLFIAASKVIEMLGPKIVIFENVTGVISETFHKDFKTIIKIMHTLDYDLRWCTTSAADVGAYHLRKRWFCLATKRGAALPDIDFTHGNKHLHEWHLGKQPKLTTDTLSALETRRRCMMLGNAIVPLACRVALARLYSGFEIVTVQDMKAARTVRFNPVLKGAVPGKNIPPAHGAVDASGAYTEVPLPKIERKLLRITVDPTHYSNPGYKTNSKLKPSPRYTEPIIREAWPTPRLGGSSRSHQLSHRTVDDLCTMAVFTSKINNKKQPKSTLATCLNPRFAEWLMGYPLDHTKMS